MTLSPVDCHRCIKREHCPDRRDDAIFGCYEYCVGSCDKAACDFTCAFNEPQYSIRMAEVGGHGPLLSKHACAVNAATLPLHLPLVFGRTGRAAASTADFVALPFHDLFREVRRTRLEPVADTAAGLRVLFGLKLGCRIAAIGVNFDNHLERMWEYHKMTDMAAALQAMDVTFATTPNFSFYVFAPRDHYVWNRRRSLLFAMRLWEAGFPVVPHLYAETDGSWAEWAQFFVDHPQLDAFGFELQTGDAPARRIPELERQLTLFRDKVGRPLRPVVSGPAALRWLPRIFDQVTVVEANSYMKAVNRRGLTLAAGRLKEFEAPMPDVSALLDENIATTATAFALSCESARDRTVKIETTAEPAQTPAEDANLWLSGFH